MLERYLIEHCSPTLASVKTANLFTWSFAPEEMPEQQVRYWNQELQARGISLVVLRVQNQKALMYVCRKHEIGVFLDYPLEDVVGFIENAGQNYKCSGCWKVYCNECEAVKLFARYKKCRDVYMRLWHQGRSVLQLTVAA